MTSPCDPSVSLCPPRRPWLCTALGNILTWYCGGTGGRACWGAAESVLAEDGAGGRGTACLGCRGPGAELPPTEHRRDNGGPRERVECRKRDIQIHVKTVVNSSPPSVHHTQASPGSTSPRTSTMCRGSWLTSAGGCKGSSRAGGAAFSNRSRRAGSFLGETMEKWIPRYRKGKAGMGPPETDGASPFPTTWRDRLALGPQLASECWGVGGKTGHWSPGGF